MKRFMLSLIMLLSVINYSSANSEAYNELDKFLEVIGQGINAGSIKVSDKNLAKENVIKLRKELNESNIATTLKKLEMSVDNGFSKNVDKLYPVITRANKDDVDKLGDKIKSMQKKLIGLGGRMRPVMLSLEKIDKKLKLSNIAIRSLPYASLALYYILVTKQEYLPQWSFVQAIKSLVGGAPSKDTTTYRIKAKVKNAKEVKSDLENKSSTEVKPEEVKSDAQEKPKAKDANDVKIELYANHNSYLRDISENTREIARNSVPMDTITKDIPKPYPGIIGTPWFYLSRFIGVDSAPLFKFAPLGLIAPYLKKDIKDLSELLGEQKDRVKAYLKADKFKTRSKFKSSSAKLKDLIGFESAKAKLMPLVNYHKDDSLFKLAGVSPDKGYLFLGDADSASSLIQAVAGEIKANVREVHSSALINGFESLMKDANEDDINILLIKDIDWLSSNAKGKIWEDIISGLDKHINGSAKNYIMATAQDLSKVNPVLSSYNRLGNKIVLDVLNKENISEFITKEIKNMALEASDFDIEELSELFINNSNVSYKYIQAMIKKAYVNAQSMSEKFDQKHITELLV